MGKVIINFPPNHWTHLGAIFPPWFEVNFVSSAPHVMRLLQAFKWPTTVLHTIYIGGFRRKSQKDALCRVCPGFKLQQHAAAGRRSIWCVRLSFSPEATNKNNNITLLIAISHWFLKTASMLWEKLVLPPFWQIAYCCCWQISEKCKHTKCKKNWIRCTPKIKFGTLQNIFFSKITYYKYYFSHTEGLGFLKRSIFE